MIFAAATAAGSTLASLPSQTVLARYVAALAAVRQPGAYTFTYSYERHGARPQQRTDRVYRQGNRERDEILSVNGEKLALPQVRIFEGRRDRYTVAAIAPKLGPYAFTYVGPQRDGRHIDYVFNTVAHAPGAYAVTQVTIDGATFLPQKVSFKTRNAKVVGVGQIQYAKAERFWLATTAGVRVTLEGQLESERIVFSRYQFYASLPASTFAKPRAPSP